MDRYLRVARLYPAVIGMTPTCVLLAICADRWFPEYEKYAGNLQTILGLIGGTALFSIAVGYMMREVFKSTSKILFQYPLFKFDETEMPTSERLLWTKGLISESYHQQIADKVKKRFGIHLPTKDEEIHNLQEAKLTIANAVQQMREYTRDEKILRQYNYEYGFCRNYLGAGVWSLILILAIGIANAFLGWLPMSIVIIFFIGQILAMLLFYYMLKWRAREYAKCLFTTFMTKNNNKMIYQ